jgi:sugar O-acyltransferase (sialic acid O-acetyltransferase NeuD family)
MLGATPQPLGKQKNSMRTDLNAEAAGTVLLYGAGGHAAVVADALYSANPGRVVVATDDAPSRWGQTLLGECICHAPLELASSLRLAAIHVAIGQNTLRERLALRLGLLQNDVGWFSVVHPRASVSAFAKIGAGSFVAAQAVLAPRCQVGRGVIVNHGCVVDHDVVVGDFAHVAPLASLGGGVQVGAGCLIGAGAIVLPGLQIAAGVTVGAGAVVTQSIRQAGVWVGVPAKLRNNSASHK